MKAVIYLDVPDWQIGQDVSVYFPDTMMKHGKCELLKEQEAVEPLSDPYVYWRCGSCGREIGFKHHFCEWCGMAVKWNG